MSEELPRRLYRAEEVAQMLGGLSKSTIMALNLKEKWPHTKIGGTVLFSPADIDAIIAAGTQTPQPPRTTRTRRTR